MDIIAKIADFGSSREVPPVLRVPQNDAEAIAGDGLYAPNWTRQQEGEVYVGPEWDVHAFGAVMLEVLSGKTMLQWRDLLGVGVLRAVDIRKMMLLRPDTSMQLTGIWREHFRPAISERLQDPDSRRQVRIPACFTGDERYDSDLETELLNIMDRCLKTDFLRPGSVTNYFLDRGSKVSMPDVYEDLWKLCEAVNVELPAI
ncbi:hypothetical protein DFJ74DRAFT_682534 [Hyaloraphidium curvatum]|nr:hypothetical protein DFJ74DRAFT_682534 [Hyaloraphidium curvatum]